MSKYGKEVNAYLLKVQKGDKTQLGKVFDLTAHHLSAVARMYLVNKSYCDDVVAEAFCKAMQYINVFDAKQDGYNWLCKITERVAYNYNAKEKEHRSNTVSIERIGQIEVKDDIKDEKICLQSAMECLPREDQSVIFDYFYVGMTYYEMAKKYGVSKTTVHNRVKKALKALRNYLKNGEQKD